MGKLYDQALAGWSLPFFEGFHECVIYAGQHSHKHGEFHRGEPCQVCVNQTLSDRSGEQIGNYPSPYELEHDHRNAKGDCGLDQDGGPCSNRFLHPFFYFFF